MGIKTFNDFDTAIYLLGGREQIPPNAVRQATGTNPVHSKSVRSRNGNTRIYSVAANSVYRFASNTYSVDASGNLQKNGVTIKASAFSAGSRVAFVKAPPHFGSNAYLFAIGPTAAYKIDESGAVTTWGVLAPADGAAAAVSTQIIEVTINQLSSTSGLTATGGTLGTDSSEFIVGTASVTLAVGAHTISTVTQTTAVNLNPSTATDQDQIQFYVEFDKPDYSKSIVLQFRIGSNWNHIYHVSIPIADYIANQGTTSSQDVANLDVVAGGMANNPSGVPFLSYNQMEQEYANALTQYQNNRAGTQATSPPTFKPSSGALQKAQDIGISVTPAPGGWWLISVPRSAFSQHGGKGNNWGSIAAWRMKFLNRHSSDGLNIWLNGFTFGGGTGMLGDYQYAYSFENSTTGSYSQQNPTPITVQAVARTPVALSSLPTSASDSQVDTLVLWRTMGNGGLYYRLANIPISGFGGSFMDVASDFFGYGPQPSSLSDWAGTTTYGTNALVKPTSNNAGGYVYCATTGGTSASGRPTFPQNVGATVADGTVTWQNVGTTLALSVEQYLPVNILPSATVTQATFWHGSMFLCGDTATGSRGRIYYSATGYAEGVAGYTDITNDDDPTQGFGIYNDNLYVFTKKAMWQVVDISINAFLPGYTVVQQQGAPGTTAPFSIVSTPNALIYQGTDGALYSFMGYFVERLCAQIMPLLRGDTVEGYAAVGTIIAACFGRDEYWFSDGSGNTFAINVMPGSIPNVHYPIARCHGAAAVSLFYESDTGNVLAGWNSGIYHLEVAGKYTADDGTATLPFTLRTMSIYSGIKYTGKGQRLIVDINPGGNTFSLSISVDGTDYLLTSSLTGSSRAKFEYTFNITGSVIGALLSTTSGAGQCEVFEIGIEGDISGLDDNDTQGGPRAGSGKRT